MPKSGKTSFFLPPKSMHRLPNFSFPTVATKNQYGSRSGLVPSTVIGIIPFGIPFTSRTSKRTMSLEFLVLTQVPTSALSGSALSMSPTGLVTGTQPVKEITNARRTGCARDMMWLRTWRSEMG